MKEEEEIDGNGDNDGDDEEEKEGTTASFWWYRCGGRRGSVGFSGDKVCGGLIMSVVVELPELSLESIV